MKETLAIKVCILIQIFLSVSATLMESSKIIGKVMEIGQQNLKQKSKLQNQKRLNTCKLQDGPFCYLLDQNEDIFIKDIDKYSQQTLSVLNISPEQQINAKKLLKKMHSSKYSDSFYKDYIIDDLKKIISQVTDVKTDQNRTYSTSGRTSIFTRIFDIERLGNYNSPYSKTGQKFNRLRSQPRFMNNQILDFYINLPLLEMNQNFDDFYKKKAYLVNEKLSNLGLETQTLLNQTINRDMDSLHDTIVNLKKSINFSQSESTSKNEKSQPEPENVDFQDYFTFALYNLDERIA